MNFDILELLKSALGGPLTRQASAYFGETEHSTHLALRAIEPTLLAGLMLQAATPAGAAEIFRNVTDARVDTGIVGKLPGYFGNRGNLESLLDTGESLADTVLGSRAGSVTNEVSQASGVMPDSALALISMAAPLLFGVIKKYVIQNNLDAAGLRALLLKQRRSLEGSGLDERMISALGFGSRADLLGAIPLAGMTQTDSPVPIVRMKSAQSRTWLPWAIAAGVAALGMLFFVNRTAERQVAETASAPAAGDRMKLAVAPTTVYFEAGETRIDEEDRQRIASAAASARTRDRPVAITGYTGRSGDEEANYELAKDRANAVRDALVDAGIAEEKIVVGPPAFVTGAAKDEEARRVDIDVR